MADLFRTFPPWAGGDVRWVATNPAGDVLRRGFFGAAESGGGGGGTGLTWRHGASTDAGWTSNSFVAVPIGAAAPDRWVILALLVAPDSATGPASVTIGGIPATAHPGNSSGYSPLHVRFYKVFLATGTTADVVISHAGGGAWWSAIGVWTVTGEPIFSAIAQDNTPVNTWPTYVLDVAIDIPANGAVIAMARAPNLSTNPAERSWTGVAEDFLDVSDVRFACASAGDFASAATGHVVRLDAAMSPAELVLGAASFSVAGGGGGPSPVSGEAIGTLPLSGSGAGKALVGGAAAGSLPLTGAGVGVAQATGTAAGSLPLTGSATGNALVAGQASGDLPLTGTATGAASAGGQASGALPLTGAGVGAAQARGTAAGALPLAGAAMAAVGASATGQASGSLPLTGAGVGVAPARGTAAGALPLAGAAVGAATVVGQAAGSLPLSGAGTAAARATGQASGALPLGGAAAAVAPVSATAAGDLPLSGAATGSAEDPASHATGRLAFAGPRLGQVLNDAPRRGALLNAAPRLGTLTGPHARVGLILNPARRGDLLELT